MNGHWHVSYVEPHEVHGTWTSPPRCRPSRADAVRVQAAVTALAGPDAAKRRTWRIEPCDCPGVTR